MSPLLRTADGGVLPLDVDRWRAAATPEETDMLRGLRGPVLDVGCGPGRLVLALNELGVAALGVDASPAAVALARQRGATVVERSVFDPLPGVGRWRTVLLLDGNIGIGGDPVALLRRTVELLHDNGHAVVEVEGPDVGVQRLQVRLEAGGQEAQSKWFGWARVGLQGIERVAGQSGLVVTDVRRVGQRSLAWLGLRPAGGRPPVRSGCTPERAVADD